MRLPTSFSVLVMVVVAMGLCSSRLSRGSHCVHNMLISGAAAQVALEPMPDLLIARVGIAIQDLLRRHDHARRAEAALQSVLIPEGFLDLVQLAVGGGHAFDGQDLGAIALDREDGAALDGLAVQLHCAGPAQRRLAADVRTGESDHLAQVMNQEESGLYFVGIRSPVDVYCNGFCHGAHFRQRIPGVIEDTKSRGRKWRRVVSSEDAAGATQREATRELARHSWLPELPSAESQAYRLPRHDPFARPRLAGRAPGTTPGTERNLRRLTW